MGARDCRVRHRAQRKPSLNENSTHMGCVNSKGGDQNAPQEPPANSQNFDIQQHRPQAGGARTPIALDAVAPALATADDALANVDDLAAGMQGGDLNEAAKAAIELAERAIALRDACGLSPHKEKAATLSLADAALWIAIRSNADASKAVGSAAHPHLKRWWKFAGPSQSLCSRDVR